MFTSLNSFIVFVLARQRVHWQRLLRPTCSRQLRKMRLVSTIQR